MILAIGEILADMIGEEESGKTPEYKMFCGGAPFNVAVNALQSGAEVGFIGRVGKDPVGKFLKSFAGKVGFDYLDIQTDPLRNTTLAFVTLTDGERDFAFFRHDTADYNIDPSGIDLSAFDGLNIVHLGSLMLSEENGRKLADELISKTRAAGKILSFDMNFRMDLYDSKESAVKAYEKYVEEADILKFSDDEILIYTGEENLERAIKAVYKKFRLLVVTLGSKGSIYFYNDISGIVPTEKVKPIDTTGAGDAFFGCLLANIEGKELNRENIEKAMKLANACGARATLFKGAVKL